MYEDKLEAYANGDIYEFFVTPQAAGVLAKAVKVLRKLDLDTDVPMDDLSYKELDLYAPVWEIVRDLDAL